MWQNKLKSAGANQEKVGAGIDSFGSRSTKEKIEKIKMSMTSQIVLSNWSGSMATMQKKIKRT